MRRSPSVTACGVPKLGARPEQSAICRQDALKAPRVLERLEQTAVLAREHAHEVGGRSAASAGRALGGEPRASSTEAG